MTNTSNCVLFEDTSIQMNNCKNKNNNIANVNTNFQISNERESSVSNSQTFEKSPEIFIHCVKSDEFEQLLIDKLRQIDGSNNLNFIASFNHLKIQTNQPETYRKTIRYLDDNNILYYTSYKSFKNTQKSFRVILRNLPPVTNVLKIKKELEILGFSVRQVFNMKHKKTNVSLPLFTVDLEPSHINEEIFRIDTLLNIDVEFEEPYNKGTVKQCENCQDFGHVWPDCVFQSRCVRCGKNHTSSECTEAENTPATCALCQGDHPANYKGCRFYKIFRHLRRQIPDDIVRSAPPVPKLKVNLTYIKITRLPHPYFSNKHHKNIS
jgi:hypothetical protein